MKNNNRAIIMLIAAAYLGYLGVKLIKDSLMPDPGTEPTENPVLFTIIGIAFIAVTAFLIVRTIKDMADAKKSEEEQSETKEQEEAQNVSEAESDKPVENMEETDSEKSDDKSAQDDINTAPESIADRIKRLSADDETEES